MAETPESQNSSEDPLKADPDQPLTEDLSSTQEEIKEEDQPASEEKKVEPEKDKDAAISKFDYINKQPLYIKIIASLLFLSALLWFGMPKCSSPPPPKKSYLIALNSDWHPLQLMNKEKDMTTFCKVLFELIAVDQNLHLHIMETNFDLFPLLDSGTVDGVISIVPPPELTRHEYAASDRFYQLGVVLVVKKNSLLTSSKQTSDGHMGIIGNAKILMQIQHLSSTIFSNYENPSRALADLDNGTIDGVIMDTLQAGSYLQGLYAGRFKILSPPLINDGMDLYLRKNAESEKFLVLFNKGLQNLRANGVYQSLINQWGLINTQVEGLPAQ